MQFCLCFAADIPTEIVVVEAKKKTKRSGMLMHVFAAVCALVVSASALYLFLPLLHMAIEDGGRGGFDAFFFTEWVRN